MLYIDIYIYNSSQVTWCLRLQIRIRYTTHMISKLFTLTATIQVITKRQLSDLFCVNLSMCFKMERAVNSTICFIHLSKKNKAVK